MSLFSVLLASLFFFFGLVAAMPAAPAARAPGGTVYYPACTDSTWSWTYNSLNQSPCLVAAALLSTCNGGSYTLDALLPGYNYVAALSPATSSLCACNTVTYSLLSACSACQDVPWLPLLEYALNCTKSLPPGEIPYPVPTGTAVPYWAGIDVTIEGTWDPKLALLAGDLPELLPSK